MLSVLFIIVLLLDRTGLNLPATTSHTAFKYDVSAVKLTNSANLSLQLGEAARKTLAGSKTEKTAGQPEWGWYGSRSEARRSAM